jgi:hypothetical protein
MRVFLLLFPVCFDLQYKDVILTVLTVQRVPTVQNAPTVPTLSHVSTVPCVPIVSPVLTVLFRCCILIVHGSTIHFDLFYNVTFYLCIHIVLFNLLKLRTLY